MAILHLLCCLAGCGIMLVVAGRVVRVRAYVKFVYLWAMGKGIVGFQALVMLTMAGSTDSGGAIGTRGSYGLMQYVIVVGVGLFLVFVLFNMEK